MTQKRAGRATIGGVAGALALLLVAAPGVRAQSEQVLVRSATLIERPAWTELARLGPEDQGWIDSAGGHIWVVDPVAWTMLSAGLAGGETVSARMPEAGGVRLVQREQQVTVAALRSMAIPAGIERPESGWPSLQVIGDGAERAWLIDARAQQIWRVEKGRWRRVRQMGEPIVGGAALPGGRLVVNTPANTGYAFALIGENGELAQRFGARQRPWHSDLTDEAANTWRVVRLPDGALVSAEAFGPLARAYTERGDLLWERRLSSASVEQLVDAQRGHMRASAAGAAAVVFATGIVAVDGGFAVRYGLDSALEEYAASGEPRRRWLLNVESPSDGVAGRVWSTAGFGVYRDRVVVAERGSVTVFRPETATNALRGLVVDAANAPLAGAAVHVTMGDRPLWSGSTGRDGTFVPLLVPQAAVVRLSVTADGYVRLEKAGPLERIFEEPLVLEKAALVCVRALSASTAAAIEEYDFTVVRRRVGQDTTSWETGPSRHVSGSDGVGCLPAPWSPPWSLRVRAPGYATTELVVQDAATHEMRLLDEARLGLLLEGPDGSPVEGARAVVVESELESPGAIVTSADRVVHSDADGVVSWDGLEPRDYRVHQSHPDYLSETHEVSLVSEHPTEHTIRLSTGVGVRVRVLSGDVPVADASVSLVPWNVRTSTPLSCTTGADGRCVMSVVPPGSFDVVASGPGFARARQRLVVPAHPPLTDVDVILAAGIRLTGTVGNRELYPGVAFEAAAGSPGAALRVAPVVGHDFVVEDVAAGQVSVWIRRADSGSAYAFEQVLVAPDASTAHVAIQLPVPSRLHGRILSDGRPCVACPIVATRLTGEVGAPSVETAADVAGPPGVRPCLSSSTLRTRSGCASLTPKRGVPFPSRRSWCRPPMAATSCTAPWRR